MTPVLRFVRPDNDVQTAVNLMLEAKVHRVLVLDERDSA